jgi:regulation of enolase protein 1 (concanavalin A-like superfamily)
VFEFGSSSQDIRGSVTATMSGSLKRALKTVWATADASVLRIGQTAKASFSACMNDDSFYEGAKAVWTSNNPAVATVSADGTVKAVSMGVATVTCAVTIDGKTVEDTFAVKVMPDLGLASLKVGGKAVRPGDAASVSYLLKAGKAPKVEAVAADPAIEVRVKQADAVPGTAVVTLHDGQTGDSREMTVNFGTKGVSDTFKKGALDKAWKWVREDPAAWALSPDGLTLTAGKGDIALAGNSATNLLVQSANSDWTADVKMHAVPAPPAQNAGLVAYQCDDNFVKFVRTATFSFRRPGADAAGPSAGQLQLLVEENGQQKSVANLPLDGIVGADNGVWLRLDKEGDTYTAWYSVDGKKFEKMGTAQVVLKDVQVGVIACEGEMPAMMRGFGGGGRRGGMSMPTAAPLKASFSDFRLDSRGRK